MVEFPKYVKINDLDLVMAIREVMNPMLEWYDKNITIFPIFGIIFLVPNMEIVIIKVIAVFIPWGDGLML